MGGSMLYNEDSFAYCWSGFTAAGELVGGYGANVTDCRTRALAMRVDTDNPSRFMTRATPESMRAVAARAEHARLKIIVAAMEEPAGAGVTP